MDSAAEVKNDIYEAIYQKERSRVKKLFRQIIDVTEKESKCREVEESLN